MTIPRTWREIPTRYRLAATRCTTCNAVHFPPRRICDHCRRDGHLEDFTLSGEGTLLAYTRVHKGAPGFEADAPYLLGWIQTAEGPLITAPLVDVEGHDVYEGMPLRAVFRRLGADPADGVITYGTKWAPVRA